MAFSPVQIDLTQGGSETVGSANAKTNANMSAAAAEMTSVGARMAALEQIFGIAQPMAGWGSASDSLVYSGNASMWTNATVANQVISGSTATTRPDTTNTNPGTVNAYNAWSIFHHLGNGLCIASWRIWNGTSATMCVNGVQISATGAMTLLSATPYASSNTAQTGANTAASHAKFAYGLGSSFSFIQGVVTTSAGGNPSYRVDVTWSGSAFSATATLANSNSETGDYANDLIASAQYGDPAFPLTWGSTRERIFPVGSGSYLACSMTGGMVNGSNSSTTAPVYKLGVFTPASGSNKRYDDCLVYPGVAGLFVRAGHDLLTSSRCLWAFPSRAQAGAQAACMTLVLAGVGDSIRCLTELQLPGYGVTGDIYVHGLSDSIAMIVWKDSSAKGRVALVQINSGTVVGQTVYTIQLVATGYASDIFSTDVAPYYLPFDATRGAILVKTGNLAEWKLTCVSYSTANNDWTVLGTKTFTVGTAGATTSAPWGAVKRVWPNVLAIPTYEVVSGNANYVVSTVLLS